MDCIYTNLKVMKTTFHRVQHLPEALRFREKLHTFRRQPIKMIDWCKWHHSAGDLSLLEDINKTKHYGMRAQHGSCFHLSQLGDIH